MRCIRMYVCVYHSLYVHTYVYESVSVYMLRTRLLYIDATSFRIFRLNPFVACLSADLSTCLLTLP